MTTPLGAIEFAVNKHVIAEYLPPGARVLDIGGGPGRYTLWLAERGHRVVLADLSPDLLAIARRVVTDSAHGARVEEIAQADVRDLSRWTEDTFDAALCLGPLYHLPEQADRDRSGLELARVVRPGGLVLLAFMTRYSLLRRTIALSEERHHLADAGFIERLLEDGVFVNDVPGRFTCGYGARLADITPFLERHGFELLKMVASQGIAATVADALAELRSEAPELHKIAVDLIIQIAGDPGILAAADHLLVVGRRGT